MTDSSHLTTALADRYRIERQLGQGGMATVYRAHDVRHDRAVAVKVLHPDLGAALGGERFLSEIKTTARLQHPHILPLLDSGSADGLLYYVMPLVTGESLRDRLTRERLLPIDDAIRIAREVADALGYAHGLGIIHRDIKPENVLLQSGHALVADFGIALAVQQAGGARLTQTGLSLGTPQYMSPEQAMGERSIDARSDIYALGVVTYEMLTGEPPFTGPTIQAIVARLMSDEPRALVSQRKSIPEYVEGAVLRALEKVPADRFSTASEFAAALDGRTSVTTRSTRASAARVAPTSARYPLLALGALFIASTAAAAWGWMRPRHAAEVVRYRIVIDSVPAVKDWSGELAISPDGLTIVRSGGPGNALLVRRRDELAFSPLPGTEGATGPFFSPDGARIGYFSNGVEYVIPLTGGPPAPIIDSLPTQESITWGGDGYLYLSSLSNAAEVVGRSEARAGAPFEQLTTVDTAAGELTHLHPELLPDHKTIVFQVGFREGKRMIAIGEIGSRRHTLLMEGVRARYAPSGHLLYTTVDGKLWALPFDVRRRSASGAAVQIADRIPTTIVGPIDFAVSATGTLVYSVEDEGVHRELTWVRRNGTRVPFDSTWKGDFASPTLSPDGSRVAVAVRTGTQSDIWIKSIAGEIPARLTGQQRQNSYEPAWSPDGRWVTYLASTGAAGNVGDVWRQASDGSGSARRILQSHRPLSEQIWDPRSNTLLVRTTTSTQGVGDILTMKFGTDTAPQPLLASSRAEYSPVVSPDGKWVAYTSNETGRYEVYVSPLATPGAAKWAVSTTGGTSARWSHRGDELFYLDLRSNMVSARISTTPTFAVQSSRVLFNAADFIQTSISRRNYDVSADDQRFLMVQRAEGVKRGQIVVVEHWADEIRRKTKP